jgi:predicted MPP superfamily phosphohydrolase
MTKVVERRFSRRSFIKHSARLAVFASFCIGFEGRNNLITENIGLSFSNLPLAFDGFRIVHISDLHASFWVGEKYLTRVIKKINAMEKDLLVITGDMITGSVNNFWKRWGPSAARDYIAMVIDVLNHLNAGDKMAVLGNHDQWYGTANVRRLVGEMERIGFHVLRNDSVPIFRGKESIHIAGTDDVWFTCDLTRALHNIPDKAFKILLSHSPDVTTDITKDMHIDLTLCGHTHGGQVNIPHLSQYFLPINNASRYLAGLVKEPYGYTYVNRGIGTLVFPLRIGAPPEITALRLSRLHPDVVPA